MKSISLAAAMLSAVALPMASGQTNGTWTLNGSGNWSTTGNWSGGAVAGGTGASADISTLNITANQTITLDTPVTVGSIKFQDATTSSNTWTLAGTSPNILTLDVASGAASLQVLNQTATISAIIAGNDPINVLAPSTAGGGTLVLSGANTFSNTLTLASGALVNLGNAAALGATGAGAETIVSAGATLNINGAALTPGEIIRIAGFGSGSGAALLNNGAASNNALSNVVLTADAAVGGSGRFDIRTGTPSLDLAGFRLTKLGANQFSLVGANVTSGNIDVAAGTLSIESTANIKGTGSINIGSGAILGLWANAAGAQTRTVTLANGAAITELGSSSANSTFSAPIVLAGNASVNVNPGSGAQLWLPGGIQEASAGRGITKNLTGRLNLGVSNFTGPLTVNAGPLTLIGGPNSLATRQITMGDGAVFDPGGAYTLPAGGTMTAGRTTAPATDINSALTLSPGSTFSVGALNALRTASINGGLTLNSATLNVDLGPTAGGSDLTAVTGNIAVNGNNRLVIRPVFAADYTAGSGFANGSYTIATYTGALSGAGSVTVANASEYRQTFTVNPLTPGVIKLDVSGFASPVSWFGSGGTAVWNAGGASNWFGTIPADKFYHLDQVSFDGSDSAPNVAISGIVMPASTLVDASGLNYNWIGSGAISGPGGLSVSGGNLSIRGEAHDFSGAVAITGGQVNVRTLSNQSGAGSLGTSAIVLSNGTLNFDGGSFSSNRNFTLGLSAADSGRIRVAETLSNVTLNGVMTGSGSLTKLGNGTLTVSSTGANFNATKVNVLAGVFRPGTNTTLGTRTVTVSSGATFDPNGLSGNATTGGNPVAGGTRPTIEIEGTGMPGQAAFWNGGAAATNLNLAGKIVLTGDATYGTPVRYDLNNSTAGALNADGVVGLTIQGGTNTLTLVGSGEKWWAPNAGATVGKIVLNQGRLGVQSTNNLGDTSYPLVVNPGGELATFGDNTNGKPIQWNGGTIGSTAGGTLGQTWNGGVTLTANSQFNNNGNAVTNKVTFDNPTFSLGGFTLSKIGGGSQNGEMVIKSTTGTGAGNLFVYTGTMTATNGAVIDGSGVLAVKGGTFNLDDTGAASTLSKTLQLNGGLFQNVTGSHTLGSVVSGGHGRLFNNAAGTLLTLGDLTLPKDRGIQFGTTGDVALTTVNGAAPAIGWLGAGVTAGATPATTGFATWDGTKIGVAPTTNVNFAGATGTSDVLVNAATTLAGSQTVNSLITEQNLTLGAGHTITLNSGGLIIRANNQTIGTTVANAGKLTSAAPDGRLVWNGPETYEARGTADLRVNLIDYALPGGGFRPVTLVKNGPGGLTGLGVDTANAMLTSTFSGGTVINAGRAVPLGQLSFGTGPISIADGGQLGLYAMTPASNNLAGALANNITAAGRGSQEAAGNLGAIRTGTNVTLTGNVLLLDQARLHDQGGTNGVFAGAISGSSGLQKTGTGSIFLVNPASTLTGTVEVGWRDQAGGTLAVSKLTNAGLPSSIGAGTSAADLVLNNSTLRYVGNGDSTDRLFTLGQGWNLNGAPVSTIEASAFGALNFTGSGSLAFSPGSYRTLQLSATVLNNGANFRNGALPENTFAPLLGDPTGAESHGFGQLTKNGPGTWILTSNQNYSGVTTVTDGVLRLGNGGTTGALGVGQVGANTVTLQNSADLEINRSNTYNFDHPTVGNSGGGDTELVQMGSGTTILGGSQDNGGLRVRVESGVLELAKNSNSAVHAAAIGIIVNGGTLRLGGTGTSVTGTSATTMIGENQVDQIFDGATTGNAAGSVTMNGGTFDLNGRSEAISRLDGPGGTVTNTASGTVSTLNLGSGNVSSFSGIRSTIQDGAGTVALAKIGTGTTIVASNNTFTGGTTVRQGVLQVGTNGTTGSLGTGPITLQTNGILAINRSDSLTLSNAVQGNGTLSQVGTGTTTIAAPLGLLGAVNVSRGTLKLDLSGGSDVLDPANQVMGNGGRLLFSGAGSQTLSGVLGIAGADFRSEGAAVTLPAVWNRFTGGTADFSTAGGGSVFNSTVANVNSVIGTASAAYATFQGTDWAAQSAGVIGAYSGYGVNTFSAGTHTDVTADNAFAGATTTGTLRFDAPGALDLSLDGQTLTLSQGGVLITPNVAAALTKISGGTLTGAATNSEVLIHQHNTAGDLEISAVIGNNGTAVTGLAKAGAGRLILTAGNTYSGETHINQGTLQIGSGGTSGTLGNGPVFNDASLILNRSDSVIVDNSINGVGSVLVTGGGTFNLRGASYFTGGLTVSSGTIRTDKGALLPNLTGVSALYNNHAAVLDVPGGSGFGLGTITLGDANTGSSNVSLLLDAGADLANPITVSASGSGTATLGSGTNPASGINAVFFDGPISLNRATTLQAGNNDRTTFTNTISGNVGTLTIAGGGRITWENDNTFTGDIVLSGTGTTLQVGTGALAAPRNQIPDSANVTLGAGTILQLNGDTEIIGQLNSSANDSKVRGIAGGPTALTVANGGTFNGIVHGNDGTAFTLESTGGTLTLGGTADNSSGRLLVNGGTVVLAKASTSAVHAAAVDLTINSGTVRLAGTGTSIAGIVGANQVDQIYDGTSVVINGGTLDLNGKSEGVARLDGYGGTVTNTAAGTTSTFNVGNTTSNQGNLGNLMTAGYAGNIQDGAGTVALVKGGNGVAIFTGNLTHTGGTTVNGGGLQIGNGSTGGNLTGNVVLTNANNELVYNVGVNTVAPANIGGAGMFIANGSAVTSLTGTNTYTGSTTVNAGTLQVGNGGGTGTLGTGNVTLNETAILAFNRSNALTVSNAIAGTGSLRQVGLGVTTLTATNTYSGPTNVDAGTLLVNGNDAGATGLITVASGAKLGGSGVLGGAVTTAGSISPGNSPGILTIGTPSAPTSILWTAGSFDVEVGGLTAGTLYDQLLVNGTVDLGVSVASLNVTTTYVPTPGDTVYILLNDAADSVAGAFANMPVNGSLYSISPTLAWQINYGANGDAGAVANDISLTAIAVPEPAVALLFLAGSLTLRRRRRQS